MNSSLRVSRDLEKARETTLADTEKFRNSISSQEFIVSDLKSQYGSVVATPESVCTSASSNVDYAFTDDSHDEKIARALDLTDQKISGETTKDSKEDTSVSISLL